jgi:glutamyl-tRNA reductase
VTEPLSLPQGTERRSSGSHTASAISSLHYLGVSHRTAPVDLLALVQFSTDARDATLAAARTEGDVTRLVIVSTCNRVELYAAADGLAADAVRDALMRLLVRGDPARTAALLPHVQFASGDDAARHLFRVTAGLESLVLGEPQILAQVTAALRAATAAHAASPLLKRVFKRAIAAAQMVHRHVWRSAGATSVSAVASTIAARAARETLAHTTDCVHDPVHDPHVVVVGAGTMARLAVKALRGEGIARITIANRTAARAKALAERYEADVAALTALPTLAAEAQAIVVAAAAPSPLITTEIAARRDAHSTPLTIIDIGMPRLVDAAVGMLDGITLVDLDSIYSHIDRAVAERSTVVTVAHAEVERAVRAFLADDGARADRRVTTTVRAMAVPS